MGCCCAKNTQNEGMSYESPATKHQGTRQPSSDGKHHEMISINQQQGTRYASEHQGMRCPNQHQSMEYTNQDQGMRYATHAAPQPTRNTGPNDYYIQILDLNTMHKNFMHEERRYKISVYRGHSFAAHHYIVVNDGVNEDITLGLTVGGDKSRMLSGQEKAIAQAIVFQGKRSELENKGTVECTLHMLTEIAEKIIRENPYYNLATNNCQTFCNMFLSALKQETYMTDPQKAAVGIIGSSFVGSVGVSASAAASR